MRVILSGWEQLGLCLVSSPLLSNSENLTIIEKVIIGCEVDRAMDVELQILKHLKRSPAPTVTIIDRYCDSYNDLFSDVRSYECFKYLHQGIVSPIKENHYQRLRK